MNTAVTNNGADSVPAWFRNYVWLVKRELWEHRGRFIYTPIVVAAIILLGTLYGVLQMNDQNLSMTGNGVRLGGPGMSGNAEVLKGFHFATSLAFSIPFFIVMFIVQLYYALDTLYADRRDRSILFWKSLPVSDSETVISKLSVVSLVSPAITFAASIVTQYLALGVLSIGLAAHGHDASQLWTNVPFFQSILLLLYTLVGVGLWYLPIWSWYMLVSSWAQRAPFLWATVPLVAIPFVEYQTLGTHHVAEFLRTRFAGMAQVMFNMSPGFAKSLNEENVDSIRISLSDVLTPGNFLSSPELWIGLVMAAGFVAGTIWMRRYRETA